MKTVVFLTSEADLKKDLKLKRGDSGCVFICSNYIVYLAAEKLNLNPKLSAHYYNHKKTKFYLEKSRTLSQKWFKKIADVVYSGISLAEIVALPLNHYFAEYLRSKDIAKNIIKTERPDLVYLNQNFKTSQKTRWPTEEFTLENVLLAEICQQKNIPVKKIRHGFTLNRINLPQSPILFIKSFKEILQNVSPKRIVFFTHQYHFDNFKPLLDLALKKSLSYYAIGRSNYRGLNFIPFQSFLRPWDFIQNFVFSLKCLVWARTVFATQKKSSPVLTNKLFYTVATEYPRTALQITQSKRILDIVRPSVIVTAAGTDILDQTLLRLAQNKNIKTIVPQHGIATQFEYDYYFGNIIPVWGNIPKSIYSSHGINKNRLVCTGYPLFDKYRGFYPVHSQNKKIILFLATSQIGSQKLISHKTQEEIYADFIRTMKKLKQFKGMIRLHPGSKATVLYELAVKLDYKLIDHRPLSLEESLSMADYVITQATTPGLEAVILNKRVIYFEHLDRFAKESAIFKKTGPTITNFNNLEEIINTTDWNQFDKGRMELIKDYFSGLDGKAGARIINLAAIYSS